MERLIPREKLEATVTSIRGGHRVVFTNGCFDLIHPGHVGLLSEAAGLGDILIVGINDDDSVRRLKGADRPIHTSADRAEILTSIRWVDYVTVFGEDTPLETIELIRPDVLVKGAEYEEKDIVGATFVRSYGGDVARVAMRGGHSTHKIVRRIASDR